MPNPLHLLPTGVGWFSAAAIALSIVLAGIALFRLFLRPLLFWLLRGETERSADVLKRLVAPYLMTVAVSAANAFRGLLGREVDWWLGALLIPALVVLVVESLRLVVVDAFLAARRGRAVPKILRDIVFGLIYATAFLAYLGSVFRIDLTPVLTTSAILSVVIGMALQDTLGNLFAGLAINLDRPFTLGDWVSIDGATGQVVEITWRATKILTRRHETLVFPNNAVSKARVLNYQLAAGWYAEAIEFNGPFDVPPERVRAVALAVAREIPGIRTEPEPELLLIKFGDFAVTYRANLWISDHAASLGLRSRFQELLWYRLQREGIEIPIPQRSVRRQDAAAQDEAREREHRHALAKVDVFACMDDESLTALARKVRSVHYARGERIFRQGDLGGSLYIIKEGTVTLSLDEAGGGNTRPFASLQAGDVFGEMSLLTGAPRSASTTAATDCEFLVIEHLHLAPLLEAHGEFARTISQIIAERQSKTESAKASLALSRELTVAQAPGEVEAASYEIFNRIRSFFKLS